MVNLPQGTQSVYVIFTAEINPSTAEALIEVVTELVNHRVQEVHLALSTPGGMVMSGITLYNLQSGLPVELITYNVGNVDSIGNVVYLAGQTRYTSEHATFMFHGVGINAQESVRLDEKFLREQLDSILSDQARIGSIIARHSGLDDGEVVSLFREQQTRDASWAVATGVSHDVRDFRAPPGSPVIPLVFRR